MEAIITEITDGKDHKLDDYIMELYSGMSPESKKTFILCAQHLLTEESSQPQQDVSFDSELTAGLSP